MPIHIWTQDQAPALTLAGAQGLGAGIAGAGQDFGAAIYKRAEQSKRLNQAGKAAKSFLKILHEANGTEENPATAHIPSAIDNMSSEDAIAEMTGGIAALGAKQRDAQLQDILAQAAGRKAAAENASRAPAFFQRAAEAGSAPGDLPFDIAPEEFDRRTAPLDARSLMEAAGHTGYNPGNQVDDLLRALQSGAAAGPLTFEEDPKTGQRFARQKNTVLPSGVNPDKQNMQGIPQYDEDGTTLLGHSFPNGKGGFVFKGVADMTPKPLLHPGTGEAIPGWVQIGGKAIDVRNIMQKAGLGEPAAPAAGTYKKGQQVIQNGVKYEFDGKGWKAVK